MTLDSVPLAFAARESGFENPFWITKSSNSPSVPGHANGAVDVVFAERNATWTDTLSIAHRAQWDPVRLSCDAVACHGHDARNTSKYIWKLPVDNTEGAKP